jgi:carboxylesterase type B
LFLPSCISSSSGFFSTNDDNAPGNYGIRDQIAALRWVNNEIHSFGGDPRAITIFGHDAGAISVNILMLTPESKGKEMKHQNLYL